MTSPVRLIWAQARGGTIGRDGVMPWHIPEDLAHFRELTLGDPVVMGRRTWDALPARFRPLPGRRNIVVTRTDGWADDGAETAGSIAQALEVAGDSASESIWIIGGAQIYAQTMSVADRLEVTEIDSAIDGDAYAPQIGQEWVVTDTDPVEGWHESVSGLPYRFVRYERASL